MTMQGYFFFLIASAAIFEVIGDIFFKSWSLGGRSIILWIGIIIYAFGTFVWAYSLKFDFLSKAISILTVINLIVVVLIGVLYFKENLSAINKLGIVLGVISVILLQW